MAAADPATVLICMDGSQYADYAFDYPDETAPAGTVSSGSSLFTGYLKNANHPQDNVILCHCVELHTQSPMPMAGAAGVEMVTRMIEDQKKAAEAYFKKLTEKMKESHLHGKVKQCHGHARSEVLRVAEEEHATMIVTGTRGMGTIKRTLLGSVSDHIVHHSHVPVLICKHPEDK